MSTWFITGCSTGLGRALATAVLDRGDNAVALDIYRQTGDAQLAEVRAWEKLSAATGFAD